MLRSLLCAALLLAGAGSASAQAPLAGLPGVPWGVTVDSVIRTLGPPAERRAISRGLKELDYEEEVDGRYRLRYIVIHPALGTMIGGFLVPFEDRQGCAAAVRGALAEIATGYPRVLWEAGVAPDPGDVCAGGDGGVGQDPQSGTRIRVSLGAEGSHVVADAISPAGFSWLGSGGGG